jgi:ABC-2 type transport system ATP-binding protein
MRRWLDLVATFIVAPPVLFLDEPTTGLDPRALSEIWSTIRDLAAAGTTVLLTTQYLEEADQLADDLVIIDAGRAVASGSPDTLKNKIGVYVDVVAATAAGRLSRPAPSQAERRFENRGTYCYAGDT